MAIDCLTIVWDRGRTIKTLGGETHSYANLQGERAFNFYNGSFVSFFILKYVIKELFNTRNILIFVQLPSAFKAPQFAVTPQLEIDVVRAPT